MTSSPRPTSKLPSSGGTHSGHALPCLLPHRSFKKPKQATRKRQHDVSPIAALQGIPLLTLSEEAAGLAQALIVPGPLPPNAVVDALHIAIAAVNGMHYLLTWNCTHIANAAIRSDIEDVCRAHGYEPPVLCTPEELLET